MIPVKLQLKNFLSYGPKPEIVDFSHYRLICLSGKNGHGKSALLDAITWSLWGQARKVGANSKPDQGLLRLGEMEMSVTFDFQFNKQKYRVRRDFSQKYGKPHIYVEFGMLQEDDYYVSLTEKTSRATQEKIEKTLGLDYETFINSSFLRQGHANEFSTKSPKERKEILSTILGLHHYDKARSTVLEQIRTVGSEQDHLQKLHVHTQQEYEQLKTVPEEQKQIATELQELEKEATNYQIEQNKLQETFVLLQQKQQKASVLAATEQQLVDETNQQRKQLEQIVTQWKSTHKALLALPNKSALETEQKKLQNALQEEQDKFQHELKTKELLLKQKEALTTLTAQLQKDALTQQQTAQLKLERISVELKTTKEQQIITQQKLEILKKEMGTKETRIAQLRTTIAPDLLIAEPQEAQALFERHKNLYQKWIEQGNWVNNELKALQQKQLLSQHTENPSCPLCEQNLSQARKRFLHKKFQDQAQQLNHRFERLKKSLGSLKVYLHQQHEQLQKIKEVETEHKAIETVTKEQTTLTELLTALTKKQQQLVAEQTASQKELEQHIKTQITLLSENAEYKTLQTSVQKLEQELLTTQSDKTEQQKLKNQLDVITTQLQQCNELASLQAVQKERQTTVHTLCYSLKTLTKKTELTKQEQAAFKSIETELQTYKDATETLQKKVTSLATTKEFLLQKKGNLQAQAEKRTTLEKALKKQEQKVNQSGAELHDLQLIAGALGKDGIQALLIEDALPEIEQEANDLLARLTDNQASISIESLRDLKKGGTRETLDINISDASGVRPYELFSGGEAFRIDFALRIAISKLLARRAGTSLQTLIIDEGFGSQDEEGLNRMMDALYTIQDDFEKIIIVSHLPAMKEQFPVHFYIQKDPNGSHVTVIEHG